MKLLSKLWYIIKSISKFPEYLMREGNNVRKQRIEDYYNQFDK